MSTSSSTSLAQKTHHRHHNIPIIDTTKLLSLDLKSTEPLMDSLLSPTTLAARLRQTIRTINDDFKDATSYSMKFQHEVDALAEEAEEAGKIGPIVLPDVDSTGTENPNKVGWVDEHFSKEKKIEEARQKAIEEVKRRREEMIQRLRQKRNTSDTTKMMTTSAEKNHNINNSNNGDGIAVGAADWDQSRSASEAAIGTSTSWGNDNEDDEDEDEDENHSELLDFSERRRRATVQYYNKQSRRGTRAFDQQQTPTNNQHSRKQSVFSVASSSTPGSVLAPSLQQQRLPVRAEDTGIFPTSPSVHHHQNVTTNTNRRHSSVLIRTNTSDSGVEQLLPVSPPPLSSTNDRRRSSSAVNIVFDSTILSSEDSASPTNYSNRRYASRDQTMIGVATNSSSIDYHNGEDETNNQHQSSSYQSQKATRRRSSSAILGDGIVANNNNIRRSSSSSSSATNVILFEEDNNEDDGEEEDKPFSEPVAERTELEKAQMQVVSQIRFVQPRSVAPSQFGDLVDQISSISKTTDKDDLEVPLHPKETDREKCQSSLTELLKQQKDLMFKLEKDRPGYEQMMDHSVELLKEQREELEKRYAVIS